jgi:hypothetical protein
MYQNAQPLRYDPTRLMHPFYNLTLDQPPYVPQFPAPPLVAPYIPLISAMCAIEIQSRAQTNALRIFMFNQYAVNNFANPDFESLVAAVVDYVNLTMAKRQVGHVEQAIQACVPKMVEMLCAIALRTNPGLENYTDPASQGMAVRVIQAFDQIAQEIQNMKRMGAAPVQTHMGGFQPQQGGQMHVHRGGFHGGFTQVGISPQPSVGSSSLFNQAGTTSGDASAPVSGDRFNAGRYGSMNRQPAPVLQQPFTPRTQVQPQEQPSMQTNDVESVEIDPTAIAERKPRIPYKDQTYRGSTTFPYFPAFHPSQHELVYEVQDDGSTKPILIERATNVDYDKHALTATVFGTPPKKLELTDHVQMLARVQQGVKTMKDEAKPDQVQTPSELSGVERDPLTVFVKKEWISDLTLDSAWAIGQIERVKQNLNAAQNPDVFRVYAEVCSPSVGEKDETETVRELGQCKTFLELRDALNQALQTKSISQSLWGVVDQRLTDMANRMVLQNLSISGLKIEHFVDDIETLINYLDEKYGDLVQGAFLRHQRDHIAAVLQVPEEALSKPLTDNLLERFEFEDGQAPKVTYVTNCYSLTYLNVISYALDLELNADGAAVITKALTPMFHDLVTGLFDEVENQPEFIKFDRHLIRTLDGRILEATKGYLGETAGQKFYLLTLLN